MFRQKARGAETHELPFEELCSQTPAVAEDGVLVNPLIICVYNFHVVELSETFGYINHY